MSIFGLFKLQKINFDIDGCYLKNYGLGCWPMRIPPRTGERWPEKLAHIFKSVDEYMIVDARRREGERYPMYAEPILARSYSRRGIIKKIAELEQRGWEIRAL